MILDSAIKLINLMIKINLCMSDTSLKHINIFFLSLLVLGIVRQRYACGSLIHVYTLASLFSLGGCFWLGGGPYIRGAGCIDLFLLEFFVSCDYSLLIIFAI
jgi:hypothetical protein